MDQTKGVARLISTVKDSATFSTRLFSQLVCKDFASSDSSSIETDRFMEQRRECHTKAIKFYS